VVCKGVEVYEDGWQRGVGERWLANGRDLCGWLERGLRKVVFKGVGVYEDERWLAKGWGFMRMVGKGLEEGGFQRGGGFLKMEGGLQKGGGLRG
jgi:hypothetical protein